MRDIKEFLESGEDSMQVPMIALSSFAKMLEVFGFVETEEFETNGWEVDFWYYFESEKYGEYCLSGSLFYGNFNFSKR
jgi:hypothetical protein